jgi:integration host factor subunit beta
MTPAPAAKPPPLTRRTLARHVAVALDLPTATAGRAVEVVLDTLADHVAVGGRAELRGLGSFGVRTRKGGARRNPRTGQRVATRPKRVVRFRPSATLTRRLADAPTPNGEPTP